MTSWGWDCGQQPGVYARVSKGYNWIREMVCRISNNPPESFSCQPPQVQVISQQSEAQQQQQTPNTTSFSGLISLTHEHIDAFDYFTAFTRPRSSLPAGTPCRRVTDARVCCSSQDSSTNDRDQFCIPAPPGQTFSSGSSCEAASWVKEHSDQQSINRYSMLNNGFCNEILDDRKIKLPRQSSCSRMASRRACCMATDNDGNPCIPSREFTWFSSGSKCESSIFVAKNQPENTGTCSLR